jgi:hypothetical protein
MKPDRREREALARAPISERHQRYEAAKQQWIAEHPEASAQEYDAAMRRLADECGV